MREPSFWWTERSVAANLLAPVGACYGAFVARRMARGGCEPAVPVICVGNFTLGGAGKTPTAIALARLLLESGRHPFFLSRGYGGRTAGPVRVDHQPAIDVGDEPLLLARTAPTIVGRDRPAGAKAAAKGGADTIIMDDGLQNPSVSKDLALAVVDGRRGIGNGRVFPAGPLRAPLEVQLDHTDAIVLLGLAGRASGHAVDAAQRRGLPIFQGNLHPAPEAVAALADKPALAFAGIADPTKFFATLESHGVAVIVRRPFPDHHRYSRRDIAELLARAQRDGLALVTTEKDLMRLSGDPAADDLVRQTMVLPVSVTFQDLPAVKTMLHSALPSPAGQETPPLRSSSAYRQA